MSALGGAVFYQEVKNFGVLQGIMFPVGVVITLTGVYILSQRDMSKKMEEDEVEEKRVSVAVNREQDKIRAKSVMRKVTSGHAQPEPLVGKNTHDDYVVIERPVVRVF